jgi:hypothetical protein
MNTVYESYYRVINGKYLEFSKYKYCLGDDFFIFEKNLGKSYIFSRSYMSPNYISAQLIEETTLEKYKVGVFYEFPEINSEIDSNRVFIRFFERDMVFIGESIQILESFLISGDIKEC